jgi:hypothetical protein
MSRSGFVALTAALLAPGLTTALISFPALSAETLGSAVTVNACTVTTPVIDGWSRTVRISFKDNGSDISSVQFIIRDGQSTHLVLDKVGVKRGELVTRDLTVQSGAPIRALSGIECAPRFISFRSLKIRPLGVLATPTPKSTSSDSLTQNATVPSQESQNEIDPACRESYIIRKRAYVESRRASENWYGLYIDGEDLATKMSVCHDTASLGPHRSEFLVQKAFGYWMAGIGHFHRSFVFYPSRDYVWREWHASLNDLKNASEALNMFSQNADPVYRDDVAAISAGVADTLSQVQDNMRTVTGLQD